jgi:PAS domain-containing protein
MPSKYSTAGDSRRGISRRRGRHNQRRHKISPSKVEELLETKKSGKRIFDWISYPHAVDLTPFQQFTLDVDWSTSPLGPMQSWPPQLRHMVLLVFADPSPAVVYWGDEATIVYNEPYTHLIGDKHPSLQGQDPSVGFAEIWAQFDLLLATQREDGLTRVQDNEFLLFKRHGFFEECYFSWKFVPIIGDEGHVVGSHATVVEVTREVISNRRLSTIGILNQEITAASTVKESWKRIIRGLEHAHKDIPLALLYSTPQVLGGLESSSLAFGDESLKSASYALEGYLGVSNGHPIASDEIDLKDGSWLASSFRNAIKSARPILLQESDGTLPVEYLDGIAWRGYNVRPSRMIVCPIQSTHSGSILAFLVLALNPRRPFDDDYQGFIHMITNQVISPHVTTILLREDVLRGETTVQEHAVAQERLSQELSVRTLEFKDSEMKFASFAARIHIGLVIFDKTGSPLYGNKQWEHLTQLNVNCTRDDWNAVIVPEGRSHVHSMFNRVIRDGGPVSFQARLTKPWKAPDLDSHGNPQWTSTCVLCSLFEDLDQDGNIKSVMATLTDISDLKWVEAQLLRRTIDVEQRELMWRKFTGRAPIGLCLINPDGSLEFGNETWWTMTETSAAEKSDLWGWRKSVLAEDLGKLETMFTEALFHHVDATLEFRLNRFWEGSALRHEPEESTGTRTTILGTMHTIFNEDGTVQHVVGWFTDISAQKAAESVLRRRMDEAIEMKQQQERFIDVSSRLLYFSAVLIDLDDFSRDAKSALCHDTLR